MAFSNANVAALPLLAGLKGLTIRNTFLEFDDFGKDDVFEGGMFQRQCSEPATPFNRRVSQVEQPAAPAGNQIAELAGVPQESAVNNYVAKANQVPAVPPSPLPPQTFTGHQFAYPRFCANCGSEIDMSHAFCTRCGFQLQPVASWSPCGGFPIGPTVATGNAAPVPPFAGAPNVQPPMLWDRAAIAPGPVSAPNLLACLNRFRYVEACSADVGRAQKMFPNLKGSRTVA